jgi:hypothetical protein
LLNVKDRVCNFPLRKNNLILQAVKNRFPVAHVGEELLRIKRGLPHGLPAISRSKILMLDGSKLEDQLMASGAAHPKLVKLTIVALGG